MLSHGPKMTERRGESSMNEPNDLLVGCYMLVGRKKRGGGTVEVGDRLHVKLSIGSLGQGGYFNRRYIESSTMQKVEA